MEWFYPRIRRGPEWKQGWAGQTVSSFSTPPAPLLTIFGIVILLLWFSQYTNYKAQLHHSAVNFQIFIFLLPVLLVFFMVCYSANWAGYFRVRQPQQESVRSGGGSSFPWGIAIFLVVLLVLLSHQSSFHSKWFGPLWRSD